MSVAEHDRTEGRVVRAVEMATDAMGPVDAFEIARWAESQEDTERALGQILMWAGTAPSNAAPVAPRTDTAPPLRPPIRPRSVSAPAAVRPIVDPVAVRNSRRARQALWVRNLGIVMLVFLAYQLWGTKFEQRRAQSHLAATFTASTSPDDPTFVGAPTVHERPDIPVLPGGVLGRIQIPVIHLDQYFVEGTDESSLEKGPGHFTGTPMPGQPGNAAIAGHRTTYGAPFNRIGDLHQGDAIVVTTAAGRFLYTVYASETVSPSQTSVVDDYGDNRLTLTTCTPEFLATSRLVVVAAFQGPAPTAPPAHSAAPVHLASAPVHASPAVQAALSRASRGWTLSALPASVVIALLLVGLGLLYRPLRRTLPPLSAHAILVPMWLCGLLLLFEQLNHLLPPNV